MTAEHAGKGVGLPRAHTASSYFHQLLLRATQRYPDLGQARLPHDAGAFEERYAELLPRFEAARRDSADRAEIARFLCREVERELTFSDGQGTRSLAEEMASPTEPLPLLRVDLSGPGRWLPSVSFEGRLHQGARLAGLTAELEGKRMMTPAARDALLWINERAQRELGLSLRGQRFVILGAAAELAPVEHLLEAGADVLWLDRREPGVDLLLAPRLGGSLRYVRGGVDLLATPAAVAATVERFASEGAPVHVGMYAYAAGQAQEWRLTAVMHRVLAQLPTHAVASCALLLSPSTPSRVSAEDFAQAAQRKLTAPGWMRSLAATRALRDGFEPMRGGHVARAIVRAQGVGYQAAQYLGKTLTAEAYARYGHRLSEQPAPLNVSANVVPITSTRSLGHPAFEAAFLGAPAFDVLVAKPEATRSLAALLAVHDLSNPDAPGAARPEHARDDVGPDLFAQQIHGGVYAQPYALDGGIRVAALKGLARKPGLALGMFR